MWQDMSQKKRFGLERLIRCMTNDFRKKGFNGIRDADYNSNREGRIRHLYGKTFQKFEHNQYRVALNLWKQRMFYNYKKKYDKMAIQRQHNTDNF